MTKDGHVRPESPAAQGLGWCCTNFRHFEERPRKPYRTGLLEMPRSSERSEAPCSAYDAFSFTTSFACALQAFGCRAHAIWFSAFCSSVTPFCFTCERTINSIRLRAASSAHAKAPLLCGRGGRVVSAAYIGCTVFANVTFSRYTSNSYRAIDRPFG